MGRGMDTCTVNNLPSSLSNFFPIPLDMLIHSISFCIRACLKMISVFSIDGQLTSTRYLHLSSKARVSVKFRCTGFCAQKSLSFNALWSPS